MKKWGLYQWSVILEFLIIPLIAVIVSMAVTEQGLLTALSKWIAFSFIGLRLVGAGLKQIFSSEFTSREIFGIEDDKAKYLVVELGFANTIIGTLGIISLFVSNLQIPISFVSGAYYLLDGILHIVKKSKNNEEIFAMVTDLYAALILLVVAVLNIFSLG